MTDEERYHFQKMDGEIQYLRKCWKTASEDRDVAELKLLVLQRRDKLVKIMMAVNAALLLALLATLLSGCRIVHNEQHYYANDGAIIDINGGQEAAQEAGKEVGPITPKLSPF